MGPVKMQLFERIIAVSHRGTWSAWFSDEPDSICYGDDVAQAVAVLIDVHGSTGLRWDQIIEIGEVTKTGYTEFLVPMTFSPYSSISKSVN